MLNRRRRGDLYEQRAEAYLRERGYAVLARNFRTRHGEIDRIVARDGVVVFVEVKMRRGAKFGTAAEAVDEAKQRQLWRMAERYLGRHPDFAEYDLRFDVIAFDIDEKGEEKLTHLENVDIEPPEETVG